MTNDPRGLNEAIVRRIVALMVEGRKIEAIKLLREAVDLDLAAAKEEVERIALEHGLTRHGPQVGARPPESPPAGAQPGLEALTCLQTGRPELTRELVKLIKNNEKILAIKRLREATHLGFKEAKEAVAALEKQNGAPVYVPASPPLSAPPAGIEDQVVHLLEENKKIDAIKLMREATQLGLKEAKDAVDRIEAERISTAPWAKEPDRAPTFQPSPGPPEPASPPASMADESFDNDALDEQVLGYLKSGRRAEAIEYYIQVTGENKKRSEDAIKALEMTSGLDRKKGACFIATAVYGEDAAEVWALRGFRDRVLLPSRPGAALVAGYYAVSPPIARLIAARPRLAALARAALGPIVRRVGAGGRERS